MSQKKAKQERQQAREAAMGTKRISWKIIAGVGVVLICAGAGVYVWKVSAPASESQAPLTASSTPSVVHNTKNMVIIETNKGIIKAELKPDDAPKTVKNFTDLVSKKFYDGLKFHRVEPNFVIQGGDPKGDGSGGSGTNIPLEIKCQDGTMTEGNLATCEPLLKHLDGALAMARSADPNSASSQFYITIGAQSFLDGKYAVFGYVTEGLDVVRKISIGDTIKRIYFE